MKAFLGHVVVVVRTQAVSGLGAGTAPRSPTPRGTLCSTIPLESPSPIWPSTSISQIDRIAAYSSFSIILYQVSPTSLNCLVWARARIGGTGGMPTPWSMLGLRLLAADTLFLLGRPEGVGMPVPKPFGVGMPVVFEPTLRLKSCLRVIGVDSRVDPGSSRSSN